jgi:hypothetical protein
MAKVFPSSVGLIFSPVSSFTKSTEVEAASKKAYSVIYSGIHSIGYSPLS